MSVRERESKCLCVCDRDRGFMSVYVCVCVNTHTLVKYNRRVTVDCFRETFIMQIAVTLASIFMNILNNFISTFTNFCVRNVQPISI